MSGPHPYFHEGAISSHILIEILEKERNAGAHEIFLGRVRPDTKSDGQVTEIHYTCYLEMAVEKLETLIQETQSEFPILSAMVVHSLGKVAAGELCLLVVVHAKHRIPAREACAFLVERIKKELPVWGKEILDTQLKQWKENT